MTIKIICTLLIFCISFGANAHQPDLSTTLLIEQGEDKWLLQVRSALTAFEYVIENHFGKSAYHTPEEFQKLVTDYVQKNVEIKVNGENMVVFQNGNVKLGHETSATFEVFGMPKSIKSLVVKNSNFSDISRNQSALIIVKKGVKKNQFTLNNDNNHTVEIRLKNSKFELVTPEDKRVRYLLLIPFVILITTVISLFLKRYRAKALA